MDEDSSSPPQRDGGAGGQRDQHSIDLDENERPSIVVVRAVSAVTNSQPLELDPLHDVVDPDALDSMFRVHEGDSRTEGSFRFVFNGCEVLVRGGTVYVRELEDDAESESE